MFLKKKIKDLHIEKKKFFIILIPVEIILIILSVIGLFGEKNNYTYDVSKAYVSWGTSIETVAGLKLDENSGDKATINFAGIELPKGTYKVDLHYQTDKDYMHLCEVTDETLGYQMLLTNGEVLFAGLEQTDFPMWLLQDTSELMVIVNYGGTGELLVTGLTITETNKLYMICLFIIVISSLLINVTYVFIQYNKTYKISKKNKAIFFGLALIVFYSSLPILQNRILFGGDLIYHLLRIEGIKDGILNGQFPVRIAPEWQQGYGYASSIFYGETLLYIAAIFRLVGFTVITSYRLYLFFINVVTVFVAFYSFYKIFKKKFIALLCTMLYSFSVYRIFKSYAASAIGEMHAMIFLPLIAYGFYRVYTDDINSKKYGRSCVPLIIGFSGLIQSHMLTGEMVGMFTIILCVILCKKTFRKKTFIALTKTVIYSILISLWFIVPFADYLTTGNFVIQNVWAREIQNMGGYIAHQFIAFTINGGQTFYSTEGMYESNPTNIGIALIVTLFVWIGILFLKKTKCFTKEELGLGKIALLFACMSMLMGLSIFPWDSIQSINQGFSVLVSSLQFPHRFLTIANISLIIIAGLIAKWAGENWGKRGLQACFFGMSILTFISGIYLLNIIVYRESTFQVYNAEGMGNGYVSGGEYLPYGTEKSDLMYKEPVTSEDIILNDYVKNGLKIDMYCENNSSVVGEIELPLLYYKGYTAIDQNTGSKLETYLGNNSVVTVSVPALYKGEIYVSFVSPWYWRLAELVSVCFILFLIVRWMIIKKHENAKEILENSRRDYIEKK